MRTILLFIIVCIGIGCTEINSNEKKKETIDIGDWRMQQKVMKQIKNIEFTFPAQGFAYEKRDSLVDECIKAIAQNVMLIEIEEFTTPYKIKFYPSKAAMKKETNYGVSGHADFWNKRVCLVATNDQKTIEEENIISPPIKHELMHMIAMEQWQYPAESSLWMNEGLATYAANNCNGLTVDRVYRYLLAQDMLIPIDSIVDKFYDNDEMIAYHQSAYIVQYLIDNYGIEKFAKLWQQGFTGFESIYNVRFNELELKMNEELIAQYPETPEIDWEIFKEGCK